MFLAKDATVVSIKALGTALAESMRSGLRLCALFGIPAASGRLSLHAVVGDDAAGRLMVLASEVGFNSNSVFIDAFRKVTGMTPTQFREHLNENQPKPKG